MLMTEWVKTTIAWLGIITFAIIFGGFVVVGLSCAPWNVAWHDATGGGPACLLKVKPGLWMTRGPNADER